MLFTGVQWRLSFRQCASSAIVTSALCSNRPYGETDFSTDVAWNAGRPQILLCNILRMAFQHCISLTHGVCSHAPDNTSVLTNLMTSLMTSPKRKRAKDSTHQVHRLLQTNYLQCSMQLN